MALTFSKSRQQAESAFSKTQTQAIARSRAFEELDSIAVARQEKNARLREARLAKELQEETTANTFAAPARPARTTRPARPSTRIEKP